MPTTAGTSAIASSDSWYDAPTGTTSDGWYDTPTSTTYSAGAEYTGDPSYPVFPNGQWISRFYMVSSQYSGLTNQDIDLFNYCYLPGNGPLPYHESASSSSSAQTSSNGFEKRSESWADIVIEKPDYQIEEAPCQKQRAMNGNCHFKNTNGTFSGLTEYDSDFGEQQHCYCQKYPFFDASIGCMKCLEMHGGIEGYHWFPESFIGAFADTYCNADDLDKKFYDFLQSWKSTAKEAQIPSTTAKNSLGTQTAASLYYTPNAAAVSAARAKVSKATKSARRSKWRIGMLVLGMLFAI